MKDRNHAQGKNTMSVSDTQGGHKKSSSIIKFTVLLN